MFSKSLAAFVILNTVLHSMPVLSTPLAETVAELRLDPTAVDRLNTLSSDNQFVYDFLNPPAGVVTGAAGHTVTATSGTFPAVVGNGVAMTIGFLGPCGINTPHTHPRATEINFSVNGTLRTGFLTENGGRFVVNDLPPGSMTVFPQGAIHFEMNDGCEPAMFVAAFNGEDPGVLSVAQRFLGLPIDIIGATMGGLGVKEVEGLEAMIPDNVAVGTDACLKRCGLHRPRAQPTAQHQPRVSGNAFPTGTDHHPSRELQ
ncbi:RmlC-like cupin [Mycena sanguinolenta]|nr:RmlC-like cupin [Mycena sanguinolenta]